MRRSRNHCFTLKHPDRRNQVSHTGGTFTMKISIENLKGSKQICMTTALKNLSTHDFIKGPCRMSTYFAFYTSSYQCRHVLHECVYSDTLLSMSLDQSLCAFGTRTLQCLQAYRGWMQRLGKDTACTALAHYGHCKEHAPSEDVHRSIWILCLLWYSPKWTPDNASRYRHLRITHKE